MSGHKTHMNTTNIHDFLEKTIKEGGALAQEYFRRGVTYTSKTNLGDLVTEADKAVNQLFIDRITKEFPDHRIITEEAAPIGPADARYEWIIDPIDGTRNFAMGISVWCVMAAVYEDGEPKYAAIYNPLGNELFFAGKGKGAVLNDLPIKVNEVSSLDFGFGFCVRGFNNTMFEERFARSVSRIALETTVWMHNFGTMLPSCYVASGGGDFFFNNSGYDHDYAATALICAEAGALVTDCDGNPWKRGRRDIVIANPKLHPKVLELLK